MRKSIKQPSVPLLQDVPDHIIASLVIQLGEFAKMSQRNQPIRLDGPASLWPIPHIRAVFDLLLMIRDERLKLDSETAAYEVNRLKFHLTAGRDVRHIDAKEATKLILGDDPGDYRRDQFSEFVKANPYLAKLFSQGKGMREDQVPLIKMSFEKMAADKRKASSSKNARRPRTRSRKSQRSEKT